MCVPELCRLKGFCLLRLDANNPQPAIDALQMAVATAKQQKATLFEMKAAIDLVEAASSPYQRKLALKALRELCDNLREDFDASQLKKAKKLLC
jgi:hypothetical protein